MSLFGPLPDDRPDNSGTGNDGRDTDGEEPRRRESDRGWHWEPPLAAHQKHPDAPYINRIDLVPLECRQSWRTANGSRDSRRLADGQSHAFLDRSDPDVRTVGYTRSAVRPTMRYGTIGRDALARRRAPAAPAMAMRSPRLALLGRLGRVHDALVLPVLLCVSTYFLASGVAVAWPLAAALLVRLVRLFTHL